jgi:branched-chain amino acid transport system permease protein
MALSFYLPFITGQISLAQAGFMAIGAYGASVCTVKWGIPYIPALLFGGVVAGATGFILGLPALRIKGIYLLLLTLGFGEIVRVIFINFDYVGGAAGLNLIPYQAYSLYYAYAVVFVLIIFFNRLRNSRMGRAFHAVGDDEDAAEIMGINITTAKLTAFTAGAFIAGVGGGILAHYQEYIEPLMFGVMVSIEFLVFTVFGGVQIFWGPIFGAMVLTFVPEVFRFIQEWRLEIFGTILIIMMIFRPEGVLKLDTLQNIKKKFKKAS